LLAPINEERKPRLLAVQGEGTFRHVEVCVVVVLRGCAIANGVFGCEGTRLAAPNLLQVPSR
jgi:hypothetical protein